MTHLHLNIQDTRLARVLHATHSVKRRAVHVPAKHGILDEAIFVDLGPKCLLRREEVRLSVFLARSWCACRVYIGEKQVYG
jgi:hypothetical protein